jgi:hypothetical protein
MKQSAGGLVISFVGTAKLTLTRGLFFIELQNNLGAALKL